MPGLDDELEALLGVGIPHTYAEGMIFVKHNNGDIYGVPPSGGSCWTIVGHEGRISNRNGTAFLNSTFARSVRENPTRLGSWAQVFPCSCPAHNGEVKFHAPRSN